MRLAQNRLCLCFCPLQARTVSLGNLEVRPTRCSGKKQDRLYHRYGYNINGRQDTNMEARRLTDEQKKKMDQLQKKIELLNNKKRMMIIQATAQDRKDDTRRAIITGKLLFAKAANDEKTKLALENLLKNGVPANQRYFCLS